jgi:hypothetical protein
MVVGTSKDVRFYDACGKLAKTLPLPNGEPIVRIISDTEVGHQGPARGPHWVGLTAKGMLVNGSKTGSNVCNSDTRSLHRVRTLYAAYPSFVVGSAYYETSRARRFCSKYQLPPGMQAGKQPCGLNFEPMFFDRTRVYAPTTACYTDCSGC